METNYYTYYVKVHKVNDSLNTINFKYKKLLALLNSYPEMSPKIIAQYSDGYVLIEWDDSNYYSDIVKILSKFLISKLDIFTWKTTWYPRGSSYI